MIAGRAGLEFRVKNQKLKGPKKKVSLHASVVDEAASPGQSGGW